MRTFILLAVFAVAVSHETGEPHDHPHPVLGKEHAKGTRHFGNFGKPLLGQDGHGIFHGDKNKKPLLGQDGHGIFHGDKNKKPLLGQDGHGIFHGGKNKKPTTCETAADCPTGFVCQERPHKPVGGASMAIVTQPKVCMPPAAGANPFYGGLMGSLMGKGKGKDHHGWHKKGWSPACKAALEKLCGKCAEDKACWKKCMAKEKPALAKACGKKKGDHSDWHSVQGQITACGCTCQCSGFLCGEAGKAKGLCSEALSHGITNGEACSKAQTTLNSLSHGLATLSGCTGTFNAGGDDWQFTPAPKPGKLVGGGAGSIGPAWTHDPSVEKPAGEKDMGGWKAAVYTEEQQTRLGVDETGKPVKKAQKPLSGSIGPAWTYDESVEKPAGKKDMGGWWANVYTAEQQERLGVDEEGKKKVPQKPEEQTPADEEKETGLEKDWGKFKKEGRKAGCWLGKAWHRHRALCVAAGFVLLALLTSCCVSCRRRRRARAAARARTEDVPVGTILVDGQVVMSSHNPILAKELLVEMAGQSQPEEDGCPIVQGTIVQM